ncbi:glycoside hydrolase family 78 protein [Paenibacillus sp. Root444D2]|uniref:glycoside hydrolase family 78 protein n=1 Tax=Paenibacillus sp. Root444D2 TaxID=1736538 RepID=UPI00070EC990|nr:alpha-L-rhamnosidase N-terminal domain-containing protein [Paenibacillus sp. Root444D2]KQX48824.1 hypothetical protein ASD40_11725 [Paenibacillus sp. Root444D2]
MSIVNKLRCEYMENPIGIDVGQPRISWQIQTDTRSWLQSAYQIRISTGAEFASILWNSGKVQSEQSTHVALKGLTLKSRQRYYYQVRVWSDQDESSDWSVTAFWEMGLLQPGDWKAEWISAPTKQFPMESEHCPLFRHAFKVHSTVKSARIYATSLGLYEIKLNGHRVGENYFTPLASISKPIRCKEDRNPFALSHSFVTKSDRHQSPKLSVCGSFARQPPLSTAKLPIKKAFPARTRSFTAETITRQIRKQPSWRK